MKVYSYISKELYIELEKSKRIYPVLGRSCYASFNGLYKAFQRRYNKQVFFGWDKNVDNFEEESDGDYVYLELDLPSGSFKLTNYLNWSDLILLYENDDSEPNDEVLRERLDFYGFGFYKSLNEFWEDIYVIDDLDRNQVIYDYLDISFVKRKAIKRKCIKTY